MKHYRIFSFILLFICAAFGQSCSISSSGREVLDMNTDWAFIGGMWWKGAGRIWMIQDGYLSHYPISCNWK